MRVGIEVGGTFTDLVAIGPDGIRVTKVPSVPRSPDEGAFNALIASGLAISTSTDLAHGSTVATNAVLERKGFPTAFITTKGFRDILPCSATAAPASTTSSTRSRSAVVTRAGSFEVAERILADGSVDDGHRPRRRPNASLIPALSAGKLRSGRHLPAQRLHQSRPRDRASGTFWQRHCPISTSPSRPRSRASSANSSAPRPPRSRPTCSRSSTATSRASRNRLHEAGFTGRFSVMQSNGGRLPAEAMRANAINALLSGPAAGVMGAVRQTGALGLPEPHHARHRRHLDRRVRGDRWRAPADPGVPARRPADPHSAARHQHHRRRRRLHRVGRRWRHAARWPALGRRRARPRLLWPRRHRAHADRRPRHPRHGAARGLPRRAHGRSTADAAERALGTDRQALRHDIGSRRRQRRRARQRQHRARHPAHLDGARPRSA